MKPGKKNPVRLEGLNFTHSLHVHWQKKLKTYCNVVSKRHILCCFFPVHKSLVTTIHLQFVFRTLLWTPTPSWPTHTHNSRPSQSYGPRWTWETTTAKHQRSKHHCTKVPYENSRSHNWPPETMMSGKFPAQKLFDHPSVSLGDEFAHGVLNKSLPALVRMPLASNRGPGIHCRCNLRCKTKPSNQPSLSPWFKVEYLFCIFEIFVFIFCINACQSLSTRGAYPRLERSIRFLPTCVFFEVDTKSRDKSKAKSKAQLKLWE